jgi:DNA-binding transcriptional MerR regulator
MAGMAETPGLTVEQLAYETGMSVRNIRNHQSRGLLPPPEVRARVGYYGQQHVERLRLIQQMQAEGFKLSAIQRIVGDQGDAVDRFLGLRRAITTPFDTEAPEVLTAEELAERFGPVDANQRELDKAVKLGLLVPVGDGRYEAPSPALLRAAEDVTRRGVPLAAALQVIERVKRSSHTIASAFVQLFLDELWKPFDRDGRPDERWPEITESIERLRPIASEAVLAVFKQTMTTEVEDAFGKILERQAREKA